MEQKKEDLLELKSQNEENLLEKCEVEVVITDDRMIGFIKLVKGEAECLPPTNEELMAALSAQGIVYGIKEGSVKKLTQYPIYNLKIKVAEGQPAVDGTDGEITYHVKKDAEYRPEYDAEGTIDYKNLDYFQLVKAGMVLCEIRKPTEGMEGKNIFGAAISSRPGHDTPSPLGQNTKYIEDGTKLVASCDGVVHFLRDIIDIYDMLRIRSNVDLSTGNIHFNGDVTIDGDVCEGYEVWSGGNVIIKGMVEAAVVEAEGNVRISQGINGSEKCTIHANGNLSCKYIESACLHVKGDISTDYVINSKIYCGGNIILQGSRELVMGGDLQLYGELRAKDIGTESERVTRIEILGKETCDEEKVTRLAQERQENEQRTKVLSKELTRITQKLNELGSTKELLNELAEIRTALFGLKEKIDHLTVQIKQVETQVMVQYVGRVCCKRKLHHGVNIWFGDVQFFFELDSLEHCCIHWGDGCIVQDILQQSDQ